MLKWLYNNESIIGIFTILWVFIFLIVSAWIVPAFPEHYSGWLYFAEFDQQRNWLQVLLCSVLFVPLVFGVHRVTQIWNLLGKITNIDFLVAALSLSIVSVKPFGFIDMLTLLVAVYAARCSLEILDGQHVMVNAFNSGFFIGLLSMAQYSVITFLLWVVLAFILGNEFKMRSMGLLVLGAVTPLYFVINSLMIAGDLRLESLLVPFHELHDLALSSLSILELILPAFVIAILLIFKTIGNKSTTLKDRRKWQLVQWMFLASLAMSALICPSKMGWSIYFPAVLIISRFISIGNKMWLKDLVFGGMIILAMLVMFL